MGVKGVQFVSGPAGKKTVVVLDLGRHRRVWEDIYDTIVAESRKDEPRVSWTGVKMRLQMNPTKRG